MNPIYKIEFDLENKGVTFKDQSKEVIVHPKETIEQALKKHLDKYKRAMNLAKNYSFTITDKSLIGYVK